MKRFIAAILVLLLLFGGTPTVSATSPTISQYAGVRQAGVVPADPECPIEVEHMLLTFDLQSFANPYTSSEEELAAYTGKVTTEYVFYNPTDTVITTLMMFYIGYTDMPDSLYDRDIDKYEIFVDGEPVEKTLCSNASNPFGAYPYERHDSSRSYVYEITLQPGQELVNTVTAPIYPTMEIRYEPAKYEYYYYPSPDFTWKSFGTLDVVINTPFHLLPRNSYYQFEKTDTGYKTSIDETPMNYLCFELCASENPEEVEDDGFNWAWYVLLAMPFILLARAFEAIGDFFANLLQNLF